MLDFFKDNKKRKAFKKALNIFDNEEKEFSSSQYTQNDSFVREYKTEDGESTSVKFSHALNKPSTSAIDLKNFKNWREVNTVESSHPMAPKKPPVKYQADEDGGDLGGFNFPSGGRPEPQPRPQPKPENKMASILNSGSDKNPSGVELLKSLLPQQNNFKTKDSDIKDYVRENFSVSESKPRVSYSDILDKVLSEKKRKQESNAVTQIDLPNKLVVEVVVPEKQEPEVVKEEVIKEVPVVKEVVKEVIKEVPVVKEVIKEVIKEVPAKPKTTTPRKPRGKSKKRFDADIVSSVDWK